VENFLLLECPELVAASAKIYLNSGTSTTFSEFVAMRTTGGNVR
jgi:hypothetical protein